MKEQEQEFNKQMREKMSRLEAQNSQVHAETTKNLYEEISASLRQRFKAEERMKIQKLKE